MEKKVNNHILEGLEKLKHDIKSHHEKLNEYSKINKQRKGEVYNFSYDGRELEDDQLNKSKTNKKYKNAAEQRKILTGRVDFVREFNGVWCAIIKDDGIVTYIPYDAFMLTQSVKDRPNGRAQQAFLNRYVGLIVSFKINDYDHINNTAIGNRVEAMDEIRRKFFFGKDEEGNFLINRGSLLRTRVLNVQESGLVVEILGVEVFVPRYFLKEYVVDREYNIFNYYKTRDIVDFYISDIKRDHSTQELPILHFVDESLYHEFETDDSLDVPIELLIKVGERRIGTVTSITDKHVFIAVETDVKPISVRAEYNRSDSYVEWLPKVNDEVIVKIQHVISKEENTNETNKKDLVFGIIASKI